MWDDPIVAEVRRAGQQYAARFNYDIKAICCDAHQKEKESGHAVVSLPPRPVSTTPTARDA